MKTGPRGRLGYRTRTDKRWRHLQIMKLLGYSFPKSENGQGMMEAFRAEIAGITNLIKAAVGGDAQDTVVWCLGQLPELYDQFCETYERRYAEEILRLEHGVLGKLAETRRCSPLGEAVLDRLRLLHECFGLPGLNFRLPPASSPRSRKAG